MNPRLIVRLLGYGLIWSHCGLAVSQALAQNPGNSTIPRSTIPPGATPEVPRVANNVPAAGTAPAQPADRAVTPEMEKVLNVWETYSVKLEKLEGEFERYDYDFVFKVEKRFRGRYFFEAPDKGRMDFVAPKQLPETNETRGTVFAVKPGDTRSWICTGSEILDINHDSKNYTRVEIPERFRGSNIVNSPLPFLFGAKASELKERYLLTFGDMHNPQGGTVHIVAAPLMEAQRREYRRAEILLNTKDFLPSAVRLWHASGNGETVYVFTKHASRTLPWLPSSPFKGSLGGYQLLDDVKAEPLQQEAQGILPDGQLRRTAEQPGRTQIR